MPDIITVDRLSKNYGEINAVNQVSFSVHEGSLFAFLGPNGAGKSTTINMLCTLLRPSGGQVMINGFQLGRNDQEIRCRIGIVFQDNVLDDLLTVQENLLTRGALYGLRGQELRQRVDKVSDIMGIRDMLKRRYGKLSGGQRRRAEVGRALMSDPQILFLDEPTTGLDPQTRKNVWQTIRQLQIDLKMTVFLTTHYLEEAAGADWVAIIDEGSIVAEGTPAQLRQQYSTDTLRMVPFNRAQTEAKLKDNGFTVLRAADQLHIPVSSSLAAFELLQELKGSYSSFEVISGDMDDVFVNITGHKIRED